MILTRVALRELTPEERQALEQLASSRTAQARFVERAQLLLAIAQGRRPSQVAKDLGFLRPKVYFWIHRFNQQGLHGLEDRPRAGRPPTYTAEQRAEVIATALTDLQSLGRDRANLTVQDVLSLARFATGGAWGLAGGVFHGYGSNVGTLDLHGLRAPGDLIGEPYLPARRP